MYNESLACKRRDKLQATILPLVSIQHHHIPEYHRRHHRKPLRLPQHLQRLFRGAFHRFHFQAFEPKRQKMVRQREKLTTNKM